MEWLGGEQSVTVIEEVIGLGPCGKTLTILSSRALGQDEADDDEEQEERDLTDSWTPRFRR